MKLLCKTISGSNQMRYYFFFEATVPGSSGNNFGLWHGLLQIVGSYWGIQRRTDCTIIVGILRMRSMRSFSAGTHLLGKNLICKIVILDAGKCETKLVIPEFMLN